METKKTYITPEIALVELDYEVSLALESAPPVGPSETKMQDFINNDPYKANMG